MTRVPSCPSADVARADARRDQREEVARLASGITLTHELSEVERETGVLSADDDLALWATLADGGHPISLAGHGTGGTSGDGGAPGEIRVFGMADLPIDVPADLPPGRGLIGQALVGPAGWLEAFKPGDLLALRLQDGGLAVTVCEPSDLSPEPGMPIITAFGDAIKVAVAQFAEGDGALPAAEITGVLLKLLSERPELFKTPFPPLRRWFDAVRFEAFGGNVSLVGTSWNLTLVRQLDRPTAVVGMMAINALLNWDSADTEHLNDLLNEVATDQELVTFLADEIERRTATDGIDLTPALDWLATTARTAAERAVAALLAARAAEGVGECETASRLVDAALADWPGLRPALMDAGEYAANRGDLRRADSLLKRAGGPLGGALRDAILPLLTAPTTGKNRPCRCGSGKKAKLCCPSEASHSLATRAPLLYALAATYAQRAPATERLTVLLNRCVVIEAGIFCLDLLLASEGYLRRFRARRAPLLRADELALLARWETIPIRGYEVREIRRGEGATIQPLPDGEPVTLRDREFSRSVRHFDLMLGRPLPDGTRMRVLALPVRISPDRRDELDDLLTRAPSADEIAAFVRPRRDG